MRLRGERHGLHPRKRKTQTSGHRQVGVKRNALKPANAERGKRVAAPSKGFSCWLMGWSSRPGASRARMQLSRMGRCS